jgi:multimeric flavodoxin WrbA
MLDAFIEGIKGVENIEIEKVYLNDIPIEMFRYVNKDGPLPHEVAFADLMKKFQNADGLVIATPTFNFSVPAQLKNFIDRIRYFALDFEHVTWLGQPVGKLGYLKSYFLVSGGTPNWVQKMLFFTYPPFWLRGVFIYHGAIYVGSFYSGDVQTYKNKKVLEKCKKNGLRYAQNLYQGGYSGVMRKIFIRPAQKE